MRYALLLGCDDYKYENELYYCNSDAVLIQETLTSYCDYERDKCECVNLYIGADEANPDYIYEKLTTLVRNSNKHDTLLFFYSGHGFIHNGEGFLCLPETDSSQSSEIIEKTSLSISRINRIVSCGECASFIVIDACHSGCATKTINNKKFYISGLRDLTCVIFASCSDKEFSYVDDNLEQGIFTYYLSEAIRNHNTNQPILLEDIKPKICEDVCEWARKHNHIQTPTIRGSISGNVDFAYRNEKEYLPSIINDLSPETEKMTTTALVTVSPNTQLVSNLWNSNKGILLPSRANILEILAINAQLREREAQSIVQNFNLGYFETAAETIWNRATNVLRTRILSLGKQFVSEMLGVELQYVENLSEYDCIELAFQLGFVDSTGHMRLSESSRIVNHYLQRDVMDEMPENECITVIRASMQYVLGYEDSSTQFGFTEFRTRLVTVDFSKASDMLSLLENSPYFYKRTTLRTLVNLISETKGAEYETVEQNFLLIIKNIWTSITSEDKYFLGISYSKYRNNGDKIRTATVEKALLSVKGFDYVPENLRSLSYISEAKRIKAIHYAANNFYNEPSAIQTLYNMGTKIPRPALKESIGATIIIYLGNYYGVSWKAADTGLKILDRLSSNEWQSYIQDCLVFDHEVLALIIAPGINDKISRWCELVNRYNLYLLAYNNEKIKELIDYSTARNKKGVIGAVNFFLKQLQR